MYTIHTKQEPFETYILQSQDQQSYIEVVPQRGCIISKYQHNGEQIMYLDQSTLEDPTKNVRGGNPVLFPISSYLVDDTYSINNKTYHMKQHGFARNLVGTVISTSANEEQASITLAMTHNEATLVQYPFEFKLELQYTLDQNGLTVKAAVRNESNQTMPFYLGYHPYFYVEDKDKLEIEVPSNTYDDLRTNSMIGEKFNLQQAESNVIYRDLGTNQCTMIDRARNVKLTMISDPVYQYIVLWALQDKPFLCIEPWMSPVDGMNVGAGVQKLEPQATHTSTVRFEVELLG